MFAYISPCNHEETDTRVILHANDAGIQGFRDILIRTIDTDIVVLAVTFYEVKLKLHVGFVWNCKNARHIAIHEIASFLGPPKVRAPAGFHAFTECDLTSSFSGYEKLSAWATWTSFTEATLAFQCLLIHLRTSMSCP